MEVESSRFVVDEAEDTLEEALDRTEETGREHGFSICGDVGNVETTEIVSGEQESIEPPNCDLGEEVDIQVHTHPTGPEYFSVNDWNTFASQYFYSQGGERRGMCVATNHGEEGVPTLLCQTTTDEFEDLPKDQKIELSGSLLGSTPDRGGPMVWHPDEEHKQWVEDSRLLKGDEWVTFHDFHDL